MKRIWFNHWFSTAYNIIELMRKDTPDLYIIGTNERQYAVYRSVCDEFFTEPPLGENEYVEFCLDFCREHKIDAFVPRRKMKAISKNISRFEELGVKVMAEKYETVAALGNKRDAYELFREMKIGNVPEYYCVTDKDGFADAYEKLSAKYENVCFKSITDEGGESYHMIDNTIKRFDMLYHHNLTRLTFDDTVLMMSERESFAPMMVMPYLPGDEISADCLHTPSGNIVLPRRKSATAPEMITDDPVIISVCNEMIDRLELKYPCNIQFRCLDGVPYILEVNTRMSGGVQFSCGACGVNIPAIAINALFGTEMGYHADLSEKYIAHSLVPVIFTV